MAGISFAGLSLQLEEKREDGEAGGRLWAWEENRPVSGSNGFCFLNETQERSPAEGGGKGGGVGGGGAKVWSLEMTRTASGTARPC